jgi:hypothetical protein
MNKRMFKGSAIQMLLASKIIMENAILLVAKIKALRPKWDEKYLAGVSDTVSGILKNDFGYDASASIKEKTEEVLAKEGTAKVLLQQVKMQLELDFRKDEAKSQRFLIALGLDSAKHISNASQDMVVEMLSKFRKNLTPAMEKELVDAGMSPQTFTDLKLLADDFPVLDVEQEVLKSTQKEISAALNDKLNTIYDEVITIAKMASSMLPDKLDAEKFNFTRTLKQVGYKEPPKKEKPTPKKDDSAQDPKK